MKFNVEGTKRKGTVYVHMLKKPSDTHFAIKYLALDVNEHPRIYLENTDEKFSSANRFKLFGITWR